MVKFRIITLLVKTFNSVIAPTSQNLRCHNFFRNWKVLLNTVHTEMSVALCFLPCIHLNAQLELFHQHLYNICHWRLLCSQVICFSDQFKTLVPCCSLFCMNGKKGHGRSFADTSII